MGRCCKTVPGHPGLPPVWFPHSPHRPFRRLGAPLCVSGVFCGLALATSHPAGKRRWPLGGEWGPCGLCMLVLVGEDHVLAPPWNMCSQTNWFPQNRTTTCPSSPAAGSRWGSLRLLHCAFLLVLFLSWLCVFLDHALHGGTTGPVRTPAGPRAPRLFICSLACSAVRRAQPPLLRPPSAQTTPQ